VIVSTNAVERTIIDSGAGALLSAHADDVHREATFTILKIPVNISESPSGRLALPGAQRACPQ
jgi:hypothetical protein